MCPSSNRQSSNKIGVEINGNMQARQEPAGACKRWQERPEACESAQEPAGAPRNVEEPATTCTNMRELWNARKNAGVRKSSIERVEACKSAYESMTPRVTIKVQCATFHVLLAICSLNSCFTELPSSQ